MGAVKRKPPPRIGTAPKKALGKTSGKAKAKKVKAKPRRAAESVKRPTQALRAEELEALLRSIPRRSWTGRRNYALVIWMLGTGMRCAEALRVRAPDFLREKGMCDVLHGKFDKRRKVLVPDSCWEAIDRWLEIRGDHDGPLFCTTKGTELNDRYVRAFLRRYGDRAKIRRRVHPHGLRATMANTWVMSGRTINQLMRQLGHSHISTTQKYLRDVLGDEILEQLHKDGFDPLKGKV